MPQHHTAPVHVPMTSFNIYIYIYIYIYLYIYIYIRRVSSEVFYVSSGVGRSLQSMGCARNKLWCHTVPVNLRSYPKKQVCVWTESPLSIFGVWLLKFYTLHQITLQALGDQWRRHSVKHVPLKRTRKQSNKSADVGLIAVDYVTPNAKLSRHNALLQIFEDAVINMIIRGRSLTMGHESRTHSDAFDWLFDRINLHPKIEIKNVDTRNQHVDMLTEGTFTRNDWDHLIRLFNNVINSPFSRSHFSKSN